MASSGKKAKAKRKAAKNVPPARGQIAKISHAQADPVMKPVPVDVDAPVPVPRMLEVIDMSKMPFEKQMTVLFNPFQGMNEKAIVGSADNTPGNATLPSTK